MRYLTLSLVLLAACGAEAPRHSDFRLGTTRDQLTATFGTPTRTQSLINQGQPIWGPIEDYWHQVPVGSSVEIWAYHSTVIMEGADTTHVQTGETELYFVDASNSVDGIGFKLDGAVYESN